MAKTNYADQLERKIIGLMKQIREGKASPSQSNIGSLFKSLKGQDQAAHDTLLAQYAPIYKEWKDKQEKLLEDKEKQLKGGKND